MINKYSLGGSAIASGGFGCVFNPSLKCENKKKDKNKISKLMIEKYAYKEYDEIKLLKLKLQSIKNYQDYFLQHLILQRFLNDLTFFVEPQTMLCLQHNIFQLNL